MTSLHTAKIATVPYYVPCKIHQIHPLGCTQNIYYLAGCDDVCDFVGFCRPATYRRGLELPGCCKADALHFSYCAPVFGSGNDSLFCLLCLRTDLRGQRDHRTEKRWNFPDVYFPSCGSAWCSDKRSIGLAQRFGGLMGETRNAACYFEIV